jgi:hypothetical protein
MEIPTDNWIDNGHFFDDWGWYICQGYLPYWSKLHRRFEWLPTPGLISIWLDRGEIG